MHKYVHTCMNIRTDSPVGHPLNRSVHASVFLTVYKSRLQSSFVNNLKFYYFFLYYDPFGRKKIVKFDSGCLERRGPLFGWGGSKLINSFVIWIFSTRLLLNLSRNRETESQRTGGNTFFFFISGSFYLRMWKKERKGNEAWRSYVFANVLVFSGR
jgi:hypothetical protein